MLFRKEVACLFWLLNLALWPLGAGAQSLPQWELGLGLAAMDLPYYRGAAGGRSYLVGYPYIIYRGERINMDENGITGRLFRSDRMLLDFSLGGGLPVPSDQNGVRTGMPRLAPTAEVGPSLEITLWRNQDRHRDLRLGLPVRSVFAIDLPVTHEGWVFAPYVEFSTRHYHEHSYWKGTIAWGPTFGDAEYHQFFYGVEQQYARSYRPAYDGKGGYGGHRLTLALQHSFGNTWVAAFARYDSVKGAVFADSPLVQSDNYHIYGIAVTWILAKSSSMVKAP